MALLLLAPLACRPGSSPPAQQPRPAIPKEAQDEAAALFVSRCQSCHGAGGRGDGPAAASMRPRPRNFTDRMWQSNVTDARIDRIIVHGGAAVGKSPLMVPNPDLVAKPLLVAGLRELVRSFALTGATTSTPDKEQPQ